MEHRTWTYMDKSSWGDGPWQGEPDKEQWQDKATGFACLIVRADSGALCGYVGVHEGHPWFKAEPFRVHAYAHGGGLNYGDFCRAGPEAETICHVPAPGEPDRVWWLGFDCSHGHDRMPGRNAMFREYMPSVLVDRIEEGTEYRPIAYVRAQCAVLAQQAAQAQHREGAKDGLRFQH